MLPLRRPVLTLTRRGAEGGRGLDHLSAALEEGDLVLYQVGSWTVDGVVVGDGDEPALAYAVVDTLQLVFTHNCEHGWIYGSVNTAGSTGRRWSAMPTALFDHPTATRSSNSGPSSSSRAWTATRSATVMRSMTGGSVPWRRRACGWGVGEINGAIGYVDVQG